MSAPRVASGVGPAPLRVGILAPPWLPIPPPAYGGTEGVIDRLARGLVAAGHEVRLVTTGESTCPVPRHFELASVDRSQMGRVDVELRHVLAGYEWLGTQGCDVIHDHTLSGPLLADRPDVPTVVTNHGPFSSPELAAIFSRAQHHAAVIAISQDHARSAAVAGVRIDRVIHHGLDPERFPVGTGEGDAAGGYLLFLGRIAEDKGVAEAARAALAVGQRLMIAAKMSEPAEREYFEREVAPLVDGERIRYLGEVGNDEKVRLLGGAAALLNPIRWPEPFGLVMIEALACGTPVVTTRQGAAPEIIEDGVTGFVCDDAAQIEDRLGRLAELDRGACRAAVVGHFSASRMVADHIDFYRDVVDGSPRRVVELSAHARERGAQQARHVDL